MPQCDGARRTASASCSTSTAANGSQNGFDHSAPQVVGGRSQQQWDSNTQPTPGYAAQAVDLVATLAARYGASPALLGFSLLNEPTVRP